MNLWRHSIQPRPRVLSLVLVAVAVGAGVWGYLYAQSGGTAPKYRIAPVERGPLVAAVSATGSLNAVITVQVGSQVSGQIKELFVDFNSVVKKRQAVARIDPDIFEAKVVQARADLDSAKAAVLNQRAQIQRARADVENARAAHAEAKAQTAKAQIAVIDTKRDLGRKTELFARQLIAKSDLDSSQALHDSAVAQFESAKAHDQALASAIQSAVWRKPCSSRPAPRWSRRTPGSSRPRSTSTTRRSLHRWTASWCPDRWMSARRSRRVCRRRPCSPLLRT